MSRSLAIPKVLKPLYSFSCSNFFIYFEIANHFVAKHFDFHSETTNVAHRNRLPDSLKPVNNFRSPISLSNFISCCNSLWAVLCAMLSIVIQKPSRWTQVSLDGTDETILPTRRYRQSNWRCNSDRPTTSAIKLLWSHCPANSNRRQSFLLSIALSPNTDPKVNAN